jgi:hypothetical protein
MATLRLCSDETKALSADETNPRRDERPVSSEASPGVRVGRGNARFRRKARRSRPERVGAHRPRDLGKSRLIERRELVRRKAVEAHVRFPRPRDSAEDDLAARLLREHAPTELLYLIEERLRNLVLRGSGPHQELTAAEDRSHDRRAIEVHRPRGAVGKFDRRGDMRLVPFSYLVRREKPVQKPGRRAGPGDATVPEPGRRGLAERDQRHRTNATADDSPCTSRSRPHMTLHPAQHACSQHRRRGARKLADRPQSGSRGRPDSASEDLRPGRAFGR